MVAPWQPSVPYPADGEPTSSAVLGRADHVLATRTQYLKDALDAAALGEFLLLYNRPISSDVRVGFPVYFDDIRNLYAPALVDVARLDGGGLEAATSCGVVGVVHSINAGMGTANILVAGEALIDLSQAVNQTLVPGLYYLAADRPGGLTNQRPAIAIAVLRVDTAGRSLLQITPRDPFESHVHLKFTLACQPAGVTSPPSAGVRHTITTPDSTQRGWLPANHPALGSPAPIGAVFGYNITADPYLSSKWPLQPVDSIALYLDRGTSYAGATLVPMGLPGQAVVDRNGIWWLSDCYGDVPWPTTWDSANPPTPLAPNGAIPECPRSQEMRLTLATTTMFFETAKNSVTRLTPVAGSGITLTGPDGVPAVTGPLTMGINFGLSSTGDTTTGDLVVKSFTGAQYARGPVLEGFYVGGGLVATSTRPSTVNGDTFHQGQLTLSLSSSAANRELPPWSTRLDGALERQAGPAIYLGLPADYPTGVTYEFKVPLAGLPANPVAQLYLFARGSTAGTLPALVATSLVVARPSGSPVSLPAVPTTAAVLIGGAATVTVGGYVELMSTTIAITPGAGVYISLGRAGSDGYGGEVGLLLPVLLIVPGA